MIRFPFVEQRGIGVAAMSDISDGDCSLRGIGLHSPSAGRERFCAACGVDVARLVCLNQVHGRAVYRITGADAGRGALSQASILGEGDAIITDEPGLPIAVLVADCVPVFIVDSRTRAIGLVHAGREGTVLNVTGATLATMAEAFGTRPEDIWALIGPSAGPEAYEVSEELAGAFTRAGLPATGRLLNLWRANAMQLEWAGVPTAQIDVSGICTITTDRFFSYRSSGTLARNMALMQI